jgi:hypothetical protein
MDRTADKISMWMPFAEAVERAGSFEALLPHLRGSRILARHGGLYSWPDGAACGGPGIISADWWADARDVIGRVIFKRPARYQLFFAGPGVPRDDRPSPPTEEVFAISLELEADAVERLFPIA